MTFMAIFLFVCGTCSDVAPASSPSAKEVASQPKSSALQGKWLQEPRSLLISLLTEGQARISKKLKNGICTSLVFLTANTSYKVTFKPTNYRSCSSFYVTFLEWKCAEITFLLQVTRLWRTCWLFKSIL